MDTITHGLIGNLISRSYSKNKTNHYWCTFGAMFPDVDVVFRLINQDVYLHHHRGFTHSFLGLSFLTLLFAYLYSRFGKSLRPAAAIFAFLIGMISHIIFDLITSWNTYLFWPARISFQLDWVFIIDFIISGTIILGILLSKIFRQDSIRISQTFIALTFAYLLFCGWQHNKAIHLAKIHSSSQIKQVLAFPQPLSPFLWSTFIIDPQNIEHSFIDLLDPNNLDWVQLSRLFPEQLNYPSIKPIFQQYLDFARIPYFESIPGEQLSTLVFRDLRFTSKFTKKWGLKPPFVKIVTFDPNGKILSSHWQ